MVNWAYLAGFIDCDGWVSFSKKYMVGLTQSAIYKDQMLEICNFLKFHNVTFSYLERQSVSMIRGKENKSKMVNIVISAQPSLKILCTEILPYSLIKKQKLEECLLFVENRILKRGVEVNWSQNDSKKYWTKEEIDVLRTMKNNGYSDRVISSHLNRNKDSICQKWNRLKKECR